MAAGRSWIIGSRVNFNGGKSQIQSSDIALGGDFPFINLLKMGTSWIATGSTLPVNGSQLDSNGYPTVLPAGATNINTTIFVPTQAARQGNYVFAWDGNGTVLCTASDTPVSGSKTSSGGSGRYVFSTVGNQFTVGVAVIGSPPITNMRLYHIDDEPDYLAGKIFSSKFKTTVLATGAGVMRNIVANLNFTNVSTWSTRKPVNYVYYAGGEFRSSFYTAVTNTGLAILGSLGSGNPTDRQTVQLQWPATVNNPAAVTFPGGSGTTDFTWTAHSRSAGDIVAFTGTGTPPTGFTKGTAANQQIYYVKTVVDPNTLNLSATDGGTVITGSSNGSGSYVLSPVSSFQMNGTATPIYISDERGNFPIQQGFNDAPVLNANATLVYEAGLNLWLKFGTPGTANTRGYLDNGWPPELYVQLGAELGMHPYFNLPYLASDTGMAGNKLLGGTDYASSLAAYVKANGPSWMIPRFEGPNENWNSGFYVNGYGLNKALLYGWSFNNWIGKALSTMGQEVNAAYGSPAVDGSKYQILVGLQTHSTTPSSNTTSASNDKLNAPTFVAAGGSATKNWATHIAIDQYITPSAFRTNQEWIWAWDYVVNGTAANLASYVATLDGASATVFNLTFMNTLYGQWFPFAQGFTNSSGAKLKMVGYEGGYTYLDAAVLATKTITSAITGATQANPCVLTLATSNIQGVTNSGNPAVNGMQVVISGVIGMTELNGLTGTVTGVSGNSVTVNIDASAFSAYVSGGTATYQQNSTAAGAGQVVMDTFRKATKLLEATLQGYTYGGVSGSQANLSNFTNAGGEFPSQFDLAGSSANPPYTGLPGTGANSWGMYDPDIYSSPSPAQAGIAAFNAN